MGRRPVTQTTAMDGSSTWVICKNVAVGRWRWLLVPLLGIAFAASACGA